MPEPINAGRRYMPGLDGLRAVAVLGVFAYHLGIDALPGGLLGVSVFFTLSGYLITDLILNQIRNGGFRLTSFWLARFRRLLPALALLLLVVAAWVTVVGPRQGSDFRSAVGTSALYVNNWWLIFRDVSYFAQFDAPGPLNHLWSLAIEEQFYLVWPFVVLAATRLVLERRPRLYRPRLALVILALGALSTLVMALLYQPGADPSRVYYGTDTRAAELLIGASLAAVWPSQRLRASVSRQARRIVDAIGIVGLGTVLMFFLRAEELSPFLYRGGFVLLSVAVAAVVFSVAHPASRVGAALGWRPMRWIGQRSYGIYLWHFPIIILTTPGGTVGSGAGRVALQVAATFSIAAFSWTYIEDPIRHGALGRLWTRASDASTPFTRRVSVPERAALAGLLVIGVPAAAGLAGAGIIEDSRPGDGEIAIVQTVTAKPGSPSGATGPGPEPADGGVAASRTAGMRAEPAARSRSPSGTSVTGAGPVAAPAVESALGPCKSVVHVGGSTSLGLISSRYIPDESRRMPAQYARVGVDVQHYDIAGGRAIFEGYKDNPPARDSAQRWRDEGYEGCWVFVLGTMDSATVALGETPVGRDKRIDIMMEIAGDDPVMWVNVKTITTTGSWRDEVMPPWNEALLRACERYDNLRVYDWASDVEDDWFDLDGVHQNERGYAQRARRIADALATAFPGPAATAETPSAGAGCSFDI